MLKYNQVVEMLDRGDLSPFNFYNIDINPAQMLSIDHYTQNKSDTIDTDQPLKIAFIDIEVFSVGDTIKIKKAPGKIISITICIDDEFKCFYLYNNKLSDEDEHRLRKQLNLENLELLQYTDELKLIEDAWGWIRREDPCIISGWNCDKFDIPYLYFRLVNLTSEERANKILSRFGVVQINSLGDDEFLISIPEFSICDLLYLYRPRDEGGLNYGEKQQSYSLDTVSEAEIGETKVQYGETGLNLNDLYNTDLYKFLQYNITDVILVKELNEKLRHIELHNLIRRMMKTPFSRSLYGSSVMFDTYVTWALRDENKYVRFGLNNEWSLSIDSDEISLIYVPKGINKLSIDSITESDFRSITNKYPGAYVKQPKPGIIADDDHLIIDMDATSLYPSTIIQSNISFDTMYGCIIDPLTYKFINLVEQTLSLGKKFPPGVYSNIFEMISKYAKSKSLSNKTKFISQCYAIMAYLLMRLENSSIKIFKPTTVQEYLTLKQVLIPAIDIINEIHPNSKEYNTFCYDYIINDEIKEEKLYIIKDILQPTTSIIKIDAKSFKEYLKENNLILTLSGGLFLKHEVRKGLFINFLKSLSELRKTYETERDKYNEDSEEYRFYDLRQKTIKIIANTTYGLFGQSSYRFSNFRLAKAITIQGRLMLKIAQVITEHYIRNLAA